MLGYNVAKKLKMDPYLGFLIGAIMCYPAINGVDINLFGHVFNATYTGTFLPVVFMIAAAAPLERFFKKYVPELVRNFIVPVLVLVIVVPIGFVLIGPVANLIGVGINTGINSLLKVSPIVAGTLLAGFYIHLETLNNLLHNEHFLMFHLLYLKFLGSILLFQ